VSSGDCFSSAAILNCPTTIVGYVHAGPERNMSWCSNCAWLCFRSARCDPVTTVAWVFACAPERIVVSSYQHIDCMTLFAAAMAWLVLRTQAKGIVEVRYPIVRVGIEILLSREPYRVFRDKPTRRLIVVSGAIVTKICRLKATLSVSRFGGASIRFTRYAIPS